MSAVVRVIVERPTVSITSNAIPVAAGGAVSSVFARTGAVVAQSGDYAAHYQAIDTGLTSLLTTDTAADLLPYTTGAAAWASTALTAFARSLLDDTSRAGAMSTLGVVVASATAVTTSDAVTGSALASFTLTSGQKYMLVGELAVTTASGSTAQNFRMAASGGLVLATGTATWLVTATSQTTLVDVWTAYTAGAIDRIARVAIYLDVTTGGTLTIEMRSEVGGVVVESRGGGLVLWEVA